MNLSTDIGWLKHHLILLVIVCGLAWGGVYEIESLIAKHDAANAARSQVELATITQSIKDSQAQNAQQFALMQQQVQAVQDANAKLTAAIIAQDKQTKQQQAKDATLTAAGSAERISELEPNKGTATANGDTIVMDLPLTHAVIQDLDALPGLEADNASLTAELKNDDTLVIPALQGQVSNDQKLLSDKDVLLEMQKKADADQLALCKADARTGKTKWAVIFGVLGFIVRGMVKL